MASTTLAISDEARDLREPMEHANAILEEAFKEAIGTSSKKWALVLVALVVGAMGAFWLVRRALSAELTDPPADVNPT